MSHACQYEQQHNDLQDMYSMSQSIRFVPTAYHICRKIRPLMSTYLAGCAVQWSQVGQAVKRAASDGLRCRVARLLRDKS